MNRQLGIAGVQMHVKNDDNREAMARAVDAAVALHPWVDLVFFSELAPFGMDPRNAETIPGPTTEMFGELARAHGIWLIPGSIHERTERGLYNTAVVIAPDGRVAATYRKMFPWRPYETTLSGDAFCVFEIPGRGRVGVCICYDQWFPEVGRQLTWLGAEVILCPTLTVTTDRPLELVLSRANAICQQAYWFNVNGVGQGGNGESILVDPEGRVIEQAGTGEHVIAACLDLDHVTAVREDGTLGVCQVLKSLKRDAPVFPAYRDGWAAGPGFRNLGPMQPKKFVMPEE